ncbi:hypothetical protein Sjap_015320 [Stephania japonica]|uniref:RING-type E3 ubiquitin transferase n=1 Tax=Stephania japonica TaxID=461633 RepID=A0AAP0IJZ3_9MAGN
MLLGQATSTNRMSMAGSPKQPGQATGQLGEDKGNIISLAEPLLASITEITKSVESIEIEQDNFIEIGCYFQRTSPAIMELISSENTPHHATEILQSLYKSINFANYLVRKCSSRANLISDDEVRNVIEQLVCVVRDMGECLSSIPPSTFGDQEYAEVAVRSLSKEMQQARLEIGQPAVQKFDEKTGKGPAETDLYSIDIDVSLEKFQFLDMPQHVSLPEGIKYIGQKDQLSSDSISVKSLPQVAEYMEPLYKTFFCPLTKTIMDDPVAIESGVTYERRAISRWLKKLENNQEEAFCPVTGHKLVNRGFSANLALKSTIEMWKERNEATRIKVARAALSLASSDTMVLEALKDLQNISHRKKYNKVQVRSSGVMPLLAQFLEHKDLEVRCATFKALQSIVMDDDDGKEMVAKTKAVTSTIKMLSSNHLAEKHASLTFLLELSTSEPLCEKIGSATGLILMLIMMKYNRSLDYFSAEKASEILKNLERSSKNIKSMAENGLLEPLLNHLNEGSEQRQVEMAGYLGEIVLGHETRTFVAEKASTTLLNMVLSGNTLKRKASLKALLQISSYHLNSNILTEAGILPILIEEMFTQRNHNEPKDSKESSAAILANILDSGIEFDNLKVSSQGHTMASDYVVYNLIHMLKNSTSDETNIHFIKVILCLTKSHKSRGTIVAVVKETEATYKLIELINSTNEELGTAALKLLIILIPYIGHMISDRLCKTRDQPENLINRPTEVYRITERHAIAANFLAKLPRQSVAINLALLHKGTLPTIIQTVNEIQRSGTRASRFANSYLEGLVGILVRFTATLHEPEILFSAIHQNLTAVFTELLMRTTSDEIQRLSAIGLQNLSAESINLSKPPTIKRSKLLKLFHLPRSLSFGSSKTKKTQVCPIHKGTCSAQLTFCLLDARAVERLLACLESGNPEVVEAALSALCTLLDDKVDVEKSINILSEAKTMQNILHMLKEHREESVLQKSFWVIEKFLSKGNDSSTSDISQDRLLPSVLVSAFHQGEGNTRQMAEKILAHLNRMPNFSTNLSI